MAPPLKSRKPPSSAPTPQSAGPDPKHNQDKEAEEAVRLISIMSQLRAQKVKTEAKKKEFDAEKQNETVIFNLAKADGFGRAELESYMADQKATIKDLTGGEEKRARRRKVLGLPVFGQGQVELFNKEAPVEKRDAAAWNAEGYLSAMRGEPAQTPDLIPPEHLQDWLAGHATGTAATARESESVELEVVAPTPPAPPAPPVVEHAPPVEEGRPAIEEDVV